MAIVTLEQLENASEDAQALEDIINGDSSTDVSTRLGGSVPTIAKTMAQVQAAASAVFNRWLFDNATAMADPGAGDMRLNNATLASVTAIAISNTSQAAVNVLEFIKLFDDSTHTPRGILRFTKDATNFVEFGVSGAITLNSGWCQIPVAYINSSGSFTAADSLLCTFYQSGDDGAGVGDMLAANNLNDVASAAASRNNLGLGTAAVEDVSAFLQPGNDLSDVDDAATAFANIKQAATETATGVVEKATAAEAAAGTDDARFVTPKNVADYVAANSAGAWEYITSETGAQSEYEFTGLDALTDYEDFKFVLYNVTHAGNVQRNFYLQVKRVSQGSYDTGGSDYSHSAGKDSDGSGTYTAQDSASSIVLLRTNGTPNGSAGVSGEILVTGLNISGYSEFMANLTTKLTTGTHVVHNSCGMRKTTTAIQAVKLAIEAASPTGGRMALYGLRKA